MENYTCPGCGEEFPRDDYFYISLEYCTECGHPVEEPCDGCIRLESCNYWANFDCHDPHEPTRCDKYTTDPGVLAVEAEAQAKIAAAVVEAEKNNPCPF